MASDADGLFGKTIGKRALEETDEKRKLLRRYDHLSVQALNPFGVSELEKASLSQIWQLVKQGNKTTCYFAEWADETPYRKGIAISRLAEVMEKAVEVLKDPKFKLLLNGEIHKTALQEGEKLLAHLQILNGGKASQGEQKVSLSNLGKQSGPVRSEEEIQRAAMGLYEWLAKDSSPLRGLLSFMAQGGVFYAAGTAEKAARAYVKYGGEKPDDFVKAAVERLCRKEKVEELVDDTACLFTTPPKEQKPK